MTWRSTASALLLTALLAACSGEDRANAYLERGQALFDQGNPIKARLEVRNALQIDPKRADAWYLLGRIDEQRQEWQAALNAYRTALRHDPAHLDARTRIAELLIAGNRLDEALVELNQVLDTAPHRPDALAARAVARLRQNNFDAARADAEAALSGDPKHRGAIAALARVSAEEGDVSAALERLELAIHADPEAVPLRLVAIAIYDQFADADAAIQAFRALIRDYPNQLAYRVQLAEYLRAQSDDDGAYQVLRAAVAANPDLVSAKRALIDFLLQTRQVERAETELTGMIAAQPDSAELRFALAGLYRGQGRPNAAQEVYEAAIEHFGEGDASLRAQAAMAGVFLELDQPDRARGLVDQVLVQDAENPEALFLRASMALEDGDFDQAIADMRITLRNDSESVPALRLLALAQARNAEPAIAQDLLLQAIAASPSLPGAYLQLAELRAQIGDVEGAVVVLEQLLMVAPENSIAQTLLARVQLGQQDVDALAETAERILFTRPEHGLGHYLTGIVLQRRGQWEASLAPLQKARLLSPEAGEPPLAMARTFIALDRLDESDEVLHELLDAQPQNLSAILLQAEVALRAGRTAQAVQQYQEAILLRPSAPLPYQRLAVLQAQQAEVDSAIKTLSEGLEATERNGFLLFWQGVLLEQSQRYDAAASAYEEVLERYPGADAAANNLAMLNVNHRGGAPENLRRALDLVERFDASSDASLRETLGWVLVRNGKIDQGLAKLEALRDQFGDNPEFQYHLGMAYLGAGRLDEGKAQLAAALDSGEPFPGQVDARAAWEQL